MKRIFLMLILIGSIFTVHAQQVTQDTVVVQTKPTTGDYYEGFTRPLTFDRMIPPYALEVTFNKTVHVIFPAPIRYVDLGSADLLAAKADGTDNVLRVRDKKQITYNNILFSTRIYSSILEESH